VGELYDQTQDEWVVLLEGEAELEVAGRHVRLRAGDWLVLPAHTSHRVLATSAGARWLAVHVAP
jgi:cupin 2 domain-containing protein